MNKEGWQAEAELDAGDAPPAFFAEDAARAPCQVGWGEVEGEDSLFEEAI